MSRFDAYGGPSHDPSYDGGDTIEWNPLDHIGDIDKDAVWSRTYADPAMWDEAEVMALVFEVEIPPHDEQGNAIDGSPYVIPDDLVGEATCYVAGTYYDWGHYCDGAYEVCPKGTTMEAAQQRALVACEAPLEGADLLLMLIDDEEEPWLPGNPEVRVDDSDPESPLAWLRYCREGEMEPFDSEAFAFDPERSPAELLYQYAYRMGWHETPPNGDVTS